MIANAEDRVSKFYNTIGWKTDEENTEDAVRFEDLREHSKEYVSKCRLRILRHIPDSGVNILDMASGPIQYKEYLEFSKNFEKRYCVDLSIDALNAAERKIGDHGVFLHGSFFDLPIEQNFFDCTISLHTIYHMDKDKQEDAVRKLLYVTKPGQPVIIIYSNPDTILASVAGFMKKILNKKKVEYDLYYHPLPIKWWERFNDVATIKMLPWRALESQHQKRLIPDNKLGAKMLKALFYLEDRFPNFFVKHFQYPMIILTKKEG